MTDDEAIQIDWESIAGQSLDAFVVVARCDREFVPADLMKRLVQTWPALEVGGAGSRQVQNRLVSSQWRTFDVTDFDSHNTFFVVDRVNPKQAAPFYVRITFDVAAPFAERSRHSVDALAKHARQIFDVMQRDFAMTPIGFERVDISARYGDLADLL